MILLNKFELFCHFAQEHICTNELLPHMGLSMDESVKKAKACYLGCMVRKLMCTYTGQLQCDDRDHYANKRIDTAGMLMSLLFRQVYRTLLKSFSTQLHRLNEQQKLLYSNVGELLNHKKITGAFKYAFSTGNWGMQRGKSSQNGVAQMMSRMTIVSALSNLRRINTPINREGKAPKPRQLHYTSWGIVCPVETPEVRLIASVSPHPMRRSLCLCLFFPFVIRELKKGFEHVKLFICFVFFDWQGGSCGLIKNLAMMAHVRIGTYSSAIREALRRIEDIDIVPLLDCDDKTRARGVPILVNGTLFMYTRTYHDARQLIEKLRDLRRQSLLPFDASISMADNSLCIDTDPGCLLRPLLVAKHLKNFTAFVNSAPSIDLLWDHMLSKGAIEYVDKQEEMDLTVGVQLTEDNVNKYTHFEMHPSLINGLCASLIPFPDHNQAPRNTYQSAMGKQAVGVMTLNYPMRLDAVAHVLQSPQKPLVTTRMEDILHTCEAPTGVNVIVVIMCYTGFNQEDSLIVNREACERGLFTTIKFQTYKDEERTNGADAEKFENPTQVIGKCVGMRVGCYEKLQSDGLVSVGSTVENGDAIIGKTITTTDIGDSSKRAIKRDKSIMVKHSDESVVDAVLKSTNRDGSKIVKVRTRTTRAPIIGDKLSSRHGQKGVRIS